MEHGDEFRLDVQPGEERCFGKFVGLLHHTRRRAITPQALARGAATCLLDLGDDAVPREEVVRSAAVPEPVEARLQGPEAQPIAHLGRASPYPPGLEWEEQVGAGMRRHQHDKGGMEPAVVVERDVLVVVPRLSRDAEARWGHQSAPGRCAWPEVKSGRYQLGPTEPRHFPGA